MDMFIVLAGGTLGFLAYLFPIPLALVAVCVWALTAKPPEGVSRSQLFACGCLPPFAIPVALLVFGSVFSRGADSPSASPDFIWGILLGHLALTALLVWKWGDAAVTVLAFAALSFYVSLCAATVAWMAVTGDWL